MGDYEADAPRASGGRQRGHGPDSAHLLALLENAAEGSRELDVAIGKAIGKIPVEWLDDFMPADVPQYTRNLAAAVSLVPKHERGGWFWRVGCGSVFPGWAHLNKYHPDHCDRDDEITARAATPELALCIASLRALAPPDARASGASPQESKDFPP